MFWLGTIKFVLSYRIQQLPIYQILRTAKWGSVDSISILLYNMINMLLVSHLGIEAISIVSAVLIAQLVFRAFDNAINDVARSLVGQSTSKQKKNFPHSLEKLKNRVGQSDQQLLLGQTIGFNTLLPTITLGLVVGGLSIVFPVQVLRLFGTEAPVAASGAAYFQIVCGCIFLDFLVKMMKSTLQGLAETSTSAMSGLSGNVTHAIVGGLGVYLLDFGLVGVAWATVFGRMVEVISLVRPLRNLGFTKKVGSLRPSLDVQKYLIKQAAPELGKMLIYRGSMAFFWHILLSHGEYVLASKRIADTINDTCLAFLGGLTIAISHHVSNAYGDKNYSLIWRYTWRTVRFGVIVVVCTGMLIILAGENITSAFFSDDYRVIKMTGTFLLIGVLNDIAGITKDIVTTALKGVQQSRIFMVEGVVSNVLFSSALAVAYVQNASLMTVLILDVCFWFLQMAIVSWYFYSRKWERTTTE